MLQPRSIELVAGFTLNGVEKHKRTRYQTLERALRGELDPLEDPFGDLTTMLARWASRNGHRPDLGPVVPDDPADMRIVPRL